MKTGEIYVDNSHLSIKKWLWSAILPLMAIWKKTKNLPMWCKSTSTAALTKRVLLPTTFVTDLATVSVGRRRDRFNTHASISVKSAPKVLCVTSRKLQLFDEL